jgi:hypothetical protein
MEEIWKDIPGWEGFYAASNLGRIKNVRTGHIQKLYNHKNGYVYCHLSKNGSTKVLRVHRVIAETFIPNPNNLTQVNHKSEVKTDNSIDNLEWCDAKYNAGFGTRIERIVEKNINHPGKSKWVIKLNKDNEILHFYPSTMQAERETGINHSHIMKCCLGKKNYKTAGGYIWKYAI